jgi:hypothetical protein
VPGSSMGEDQAVQQHVMRQKHLPHEKQPQLSRQQQWK